MYSLFILEEGLQTRRERNVRELAPRFVMQSSRFSTEGTVGLILVLPGVCDARIDTAIDKPWCDPRQKCEASVTDVQRIKVKFMTE